MSQNTDQNNKTSGQAEKQKAPQGADNLVNGIVLEFSIQRQISETDVAELNLPEKLHPKKNDVIAESTSNLIPISSVLNRLEERASVNVDLLVLEAQVKTITTFVTEAKVLEIEMNKLIKGIFGKNPELKPYLLRMKKLLQDHANIEKALESAKAGPPISDEKKAA